MAKVGMVVMGVADLRRAVDFWTAALAYQVRDGADDTWVQVGDPNGAGAELALQLSESPPERRPRMHLDLFPTGGRSQQQEVQRLIDLGATKPDWDLYPPDPDFVVLADPDGNLFCVIDTVGD